MNWSSRLKIAIHLLELLLFFERFLNYIFFLKKIGNIFSCRKKLVHCDWKADQIAIDLELNVKLVDLKSLRTFSKGRKNVFLSISSFFSMKRTRC